MRNKSDIRWLDLSWPTLVICAIFGGCLLATQTPPETLKTIVRDTLFRPKTPVKVEPDRVLIVTADPAPLLAKSLAEAAAQLARNPDAVRVAVLDARVRDSVAIERTLRGSFPATPIVVLPRSIRQEMITPLLIDRI